MWYIVQSVKLKDVGAILKSMEWPKPPSCFLTPLLSRLKQERKIDKDLSSLFFFFWKSDLKRYFFSTLCCCPRLFSAVASSLLSSCYKVCGYLQTFMITFLTTFTQKTETIRTNRFFVTYQRMYLSRFLSPFRAFKSVSLKLKPKKEKKMKVWIIHLDPHFCPVLQCNIVKLYCGIFRAFSWPYWVKCT